MNADRLTLIDASGNPLAELSVTEDKEGWLTGKATSMRLPSEIQAALAWYDEVVENQMLSFLDPAADAIEEFGLRIRYPNGAAHRVFSFHLNRQDEVSFRITLTPFPACSTKSQS